MLKGSSSNRRYITQGGSPPPAPSFAWGFNISNPSQLVTPTGGGLNLAQRRLNELQAGWDVGARFPRIDGETAEADRCRTVGFPKWIAILGSGKNFCTDATALNYLAVYPEAWIEPGNELNLGSPWTYQALAARHIQFYQNVKAVYPNCTILLASIGNSEATQGNLSPLQWAQGLAANGCTKGTAFDIANYHSYEMDFYNWKTVDGSGNSVQKTFGFPQYVFSEWGKRSDGTGGGETTQATTVGQYMDWIVDDPLCVGGHIYAINDDAEGGPQGSAPYYWGLRRLDGTHKPAWDVYAAKALPLPPVESGWTRVLTTTFDTDGVVPNPWFTYEFTAGAYGWYLDSHVIVSGGICTLRSSYEPTGPAAGTGQANYDNATGAGWYQGTLAIAPAFRTSTYPWNNRDARVTFRMRVVSTGGKVSHRNMPLRWGYPSPYNGTAGTGADGEEDWMEDDGSFTGHTCFIHWLPGGVPPAGTVSTAWGGAVDNRNWHTYKIQRVGQVITGWVDDVQRMTITPTTTQLPPTSLRTIVFQQNNTLPTPQTGTTGGEDIEIDWIVVDVPS